MLLYKVAEPNEALIISGLRAHSGRTHRDALARWRGQSVSLAGGTAGVGGRRRPQQARKLIARFKDAAPAKGYVLFETGYGPSGLPHIGTFGEVARTSWVRQAFEMLSEVPTRLIAFSDDMDGLRKVPDNVPNQDMLREYLGRSSQRIA